MLLNYKSFFLQNILFENLIISFNAFENLYFFIAINNNYNEFIFYKEIKKIKLISTIFS